MDRAHWWKNATVYQIYPLSFADSNGDGYGDLPGITERLSYLGGQRDSLGVDAIWLSPIFRSPMVDFGYDVSDHCDVDPRFGSLADADVLISEAHRLGLKVLLDYVPNHTSDQHPWFEQARRSRTDAHRDFYIWADPAPGGGPPNNWLSAFERVGPAWSFDDTTDQYYLHSYTAEQPDLNWRNPAVRKEMHDVLRFWLGRGVDGFRVDAPHRLGKDVLLRDNAPDVVNLRVATQLDERRHRNLDDPFVHEVLRGIRAVVDEYPNTVLVGEVGIHHRQRRLSYHGAGDELHLIFDFGFWTNPWDARAFAASGRDMSVTVAGGGWPTHALSNHDLSRHASRYARQVQSGVEAEPRARVAAVMLATLPGTTFLYYGEEIGMTDVAVPPEQATDPNGRDPARTPMQWNLAANAAGFSDGLPWRPVPNGGVDVATQRADPGSLLHLYQRLLRLRREHSCLTVGSYRELPCDDGIYGYRRDYEGQTLLVLLNFTDRARRVVLDTADSRVAARIVASSHHAAVGFDVELSAIDLRADQAVVLEKRAPRS
jgi:alpha-glucosidase